MRFPAPSNAAVNSPWPRVASTAAISAAKDSAFVSAEAADCWVSSSRRRASRNRLAGERMAR